MKRTRTLWLGVLASLAIAPSCWAQVPAAPALGAAPALPGAAPAAAPAALGNLWSFLLPNAAQKANCKNCFCNSAIGQMATAAVAPMSAMSGGLMQNCCLNNSILNNIANKAADDPQGAAARIMKDEEDAKARRAAVRFLGTVDCNYWPEAKAALINGLRADRNECVRFEAALSLQRGCCCNNEVVVALRICVTGSKEDGNPAETSDRVRAAAMDALEHCLVPAPAIEEEKKKDLQKTELHPKTAPADYYRKIADMPRDKVVEGARAVLVSMQKASKTQAAGATAKGAVPAAPGIVPRPSSVSGILTHAFAPGSVAAAGNGGGTPANGQARSPFFSGLTKTLTGKQDGGVIGRQEIVLPPGKEIIVPARPDSTVPLRRETPPPPIRPDLLPRTSSNVPLPLSNQPHEMRGFVTEDN